MIDKVIKETNNTIQQNGPKKGSAIVVGAFIGVGLLGIGIIWWRNWNHANSRKEIIREQGEVDIKKDDVKTDNNIREDNAKTDNKIRLEEAKTESKIKLQQAKEYLYSKRKSADENEAVVNVENVNLPPTYDEVIHKNNDFTDSGLRIFTSYFHWYETGGIVGYNNSGKSTLVRQIARGFSQGHQEVNLFPDWQDGKGVAVLLVALEHNGSHFKQYDADQNKSFPNLRIITNFDSITELEAVIQKTADENPSGLVLFIDNYEKLYSLISNNKERAISNFGKWLEKLKNTRYEKRQPFTCINVFHTKKDYKTSKSLELCDVAGNANYTRFCQDFLAFSGCKLGDNFRILKILKNKYEENRSMVSVLRFSDSKIWMFEHVEEANEVDVLPISQMCNSNSGEYTKKKVCGKRGRKERFSLDELKAIDEELRVGFSWREIMENRGLQFSKDKKKGIKVALKRHGLGL